ncbi:hypothetical protein BKA64DRAFT_91672 [Cadophora sp. MPI-SDFR-AT-0126]|nr:hypothetical protein BKA64DRAFT_91672 [Leotiomycetes sp. MPI-SDFR-AT-0126]
MASSSSAIDPIQNVEKNHVQPPRRRGRPRLESTLGSREDVVAHRKERVRLAQRAYRDRRDTKVDDLKARIMKLEHALEQITLSSSRFQNLMSAKEDLPPRLALEISKITLEIASAVQKARSEEPLQIAGGPKKSVDCEAIAAVDVIDQGTISREVMPIEVARVSSSNTASTAFSSGFPSGDVPHSVPSMDSSTTTGVQQHSALVDLKTPRGTWFTSLLLRLCSEQGLQLLTSPDTTFDDLHPALSIHLTWVTIDQLREQCLRARASNFEHMHEDPEQGIIFGCPRLYRSIEGSDGIVVPRAGKLEPQQLVHGRTRTKLETGLRDFQGEWLEPIDVLEFLEDMGIFLVDSGQGGVLQIAIPEDNLGDIWSHDANAVFTEEIQRSRVLASWPIVKEAQHNDLTISQGGHAQVSERETPMFVEQVHALDASHKKVTAVLDSFLQHQTLSSASQFDSEYQCNSPTTIENFINITLRLDRLMRFLVLAASCIGPSPGIRKEAIEHALRLSISKH